MSGHNNMAPTLETKAALNVVITSLQEAHELWHIADEAYHEPREFRRQLNVVIQATRNVTFRLQSQKNFIVVFDEWYTRWQHALAGDKAMSLINKSRIAVVKKSGLQLASSATIEVLATYDEPFRHSESVDPMLPSDSLLSAFVSRAPDLPENAIVTLTRNWSTVELSGEDVLAVVARAICGLHVLVEDLLAHAEGRDTGAPAELLKVRELPDCMRRSARSRALSMNVALRSIQDVALENREYDVGVGKLAAARYGLHSIAPPPDSLEGFGLWLLAIAKKMLRKDGSHTSILWIRSAGADWMMVALAPKDVTEKLILSREAARMVSDLRADAFAFVGEVWLLSRSDAYRRFEIPQGVEQSSRHREALIVHVEDAAGNGRLWLTPFRRRFGRIRLSRTMDESTDSFDWADPIRRVWEASRSLPSESV